MASGGLRDGVSLNGPSLDATVARKEDAPETEEEFRTPEFDEDQFIHREIVSFRTTAILFVWGIVAALASWAVFATVDGHSAGWYIGLAIAALFGLSLKVLFPRLGADIKHFGRREWMGTGFLFFFTWLAFFMLLVNPPVGDYAAPRVDAVVTPAVQQAGGVVALDLFFADNDRIAEHSFALWRGDGDAREDIAGTDDLVRVSGGHYRYEALALPAGLYHYRADAEDPKGKAGEAAGSFSVTSQAVQYYGPDGGALDAPTDQVAVQSHDGLPACESRKAGKQRVATGPAGCVRDVRLVRDDGTVHLQWNEEARSWVAYPTFEGWKAGNNTFRIEAETADQFEHFTRVEGAVITLPGPYMVDVEVALPAEPVAIKVPLDSSGPSRNVPGPGLPLLAAGLLAAVAVARRRGDGPSQD